MGGGHTQVPRSVGQKIHRAKRPERIAGRESSGTHPSGGRFGRACRTRISVPGLPGAACVRATALNGPRSPAAGPGAGCHSRALRTPKASRAVHPDHSASNTRAHHSSDTRLQFYEALGAPCRGRPDAAPEAISSRRRCRASRSPAGTRQLLGPDVPEPVPVAIRQCEHPVRPGAQE